VKSRYFYFAAGAAFLVGTVVKLMPPRNLTAAILDAVAGGIFLFLGAFPQTRG
jgi:hypothetical protein